MKATIEVKLKPFQVPNFVLTETAPKPRQEGIQEAPKYALEELDAETLEKLCDEFTDAVFKKAGKRRPPRATCG
jgi:hypothetical protein